jgi:hypothetical protein
LGWTLLHRPLESDSFESGNAFRGKFSSLVILALIVALRKSYPAAIRPECPDHPWKSLLDQPPPEGHTFEVFCADGVTRSAKTLEMAGGEIVL